MDRKTLKKLDNTEVQKLSVLFFKMVEPNIHKAKTIFELRKDAKSSFYNSKDIRTNGFYKALSRLLSKTVYEQIQD